MIPVLEESNVGNNMHKPTNGGQRSTGFDWGESQMLLEHKVQASKSDSQIWGQGKDSGGDDV